jgi:2-keto-4-pentenoate hydratase
VALAEFPGPLPPDIASGYAIQEAAIGLWQDRIAGWKVGLVPPTERQALGTTRLAGPIFLRSVLQAARGAQPVRLAAIAGGFAAIEVELVVAAGSDAQPDKTQWSLEEAAALVGAWHLGMEFAASPLARINDLGAAVTVSDFGNNSGLIIGPRLDAALVADPANLLCRATIDSKPVGHASAATLPGGPLEALRFLLGHLAARGRPLRAGQWVSTGAITGVHRIFPGQEASVELVGRERIDVIVAAAAPSDGPRS